MSLVLHPYPEFCISTERLFDVILLFRIDTNCCIKTIVARLGKSFTCGKRDDIATKGTGPTPRP